MRRHYVTCFSHEGTRIDVDPTHVIAIENVPDPERRFEQERTLLYLTGGNTIIVRGWCGSLTKRISSARADAEADKLSSAVRTAVQVASEINAPRVEPEMVDAMEFVDRYLKQRRSAA